jgi:hypothetical protein
VGHVFVRRGGWTVGVLAVLLLTGSSAFGARTLVTSPTRIQGFAQDGPFIAWSTSTPHTFTCRTFIRSLPTGRRAEFGSGSSSCSGLRERRLALAGRRVLWEATPGYCGTCNPTRIFSATFGRPNVVSLGTFEDTYSGGRQVTGLVGDGQLLAYSWVELWLLYDAEGRDCISYPVPCMWKVVRGRTAAVINDASERIPGVHRPALLAAGGARLAVAPSLEHWSGFDRRVRPVRNGAIEVLDPKTGVLLTSVFPSGTARALALSAGALAVFLERGDGSRAIERYSVPAGTLIAATPVDSHAAFTLDIAGKWIVYRVRHQVRLIGPLGGDRLLTTARDAPLGLSIEGRRVAWAENRPGRHAIRTALAPR